jgi:hypothetical protein
MHERQHPPDQLIYAQLTRPVSIHRRHAGRARTPVVGAWERWCVCGVPRGGGWLTMHACTCVLDVLSTAPQALHNGAKHHHAHDHAPLASAARGRPQPFTKSYLGLLVCRSPRACFRLQCCSSTRTHMHAATNKTGPPTQQGCDTWLKTAEPQRHVRTPTTSA